MVDLVITFGETTVTAFGTFEIKFEGGAKAGAIKDVFSKKILGGDLTLASGGSANSATTVSDPAAYQHCGSARRCDCSLERSTAVGAGSDSIEDQSHYF
jgi:hypothetical protein